MPKDRHVEFDFTIEPKGLTRPLYKQVHSNALIQVDETNFSMLYDSPPEADGAFTHVPGLKLSVFTADCLPLLFYTEDSSGPIATIHCGWRGALKSIVNPIEDLWEDYRDQIHVILGPALGPCCFEVKGDLIEAFHKEGHNITPYILSQNQNTFFCLSDFVINEQLAFIKRKNINTSFLRCTYCSSPELPSYRRNKGTDPRIRGWIYKTNI